MRVSKSLSDKKNAIDGIQSTVQKDKKILREALLNTLSLNSWRKQALRSHKILNMKIEIEIG